MPEKGLHLKYRQALSSRISLQKQKYPQDVVILKFLVLLRQPEVGFQDSLGATSSPQLAESVKAKILVRSGMTSVKTS